MATVKNTSGDYIITVAGGAGNLTINADLDVVGNITYINSTALEITDPFITVAAQNTGAIQSMGLVAQKTTTTWAGLRFNTVSSAWEISPAVDTDGGPITPYSAIMSGAATTPGAPLNSLQFNSASTFAGNAALTFDAGTAKLTLLGHQVYGNTALPANVANAVALYSNVVGSGGTGLYFTSSTAAGELVSKTKAIVFGIIF
jgi:hypothetical protein